MRQLINDGWFFVKMPSGSTWQDAESAAWSPVDLPHDWLIWQESDLYETADAWYRRELELPEGHEPVVMIRFDGVYMDCDVLLNGELICTHPYGYTCFDADLTGKVKPDANVLTVHIRHRSPNSRWYSGSGIFRDVFLVTLPENHLIPDSVYLKETAQKNSWQLLVSADTEGIPQEFRCTLRTADGETAACAEGVCREGTVQACLTIPDARTWSPEDPYLYQLEIQYGKQTEVLKTGLRSVFADPEKGLLLNGKRVRLKGVCLHHDLGALGAAFHQKAARRQLQLMLDMGANAVRTSHNPPAAGFLDLCDEMGILVVDEAFDMWERSKTEWDYARFFPAWSVRDTAAWVKRDRCHACVIMWSIGNEIYDMHADERGAEITRMLTEQVRIHDPLKRAFVTFGCNYMPWAGGQRCAELVDIVGYNYGERLYEKHHALHPDWILYGSETASMLSSRGIYHFPMRQSIMSEADSQCSALGNSNTSWGAESLKRILSDDLRQSLSLGQFLWSGIDYIGEPTPYHTRSCYFGQADTACFPKDAYYLVQSYWTKKPMIHIGVSWDWNQGQIIDIPVMTNCPEAELFLNGVSLGRKQNDPDGKDLFPTGWQAPFTPGELKARGYDSEGNILCEDIRFTPGETDHLRLECEEQEMLSDGEDLVFVTVTAEDRDNHPVENARDRIKASVTGGGRLIGTDNGDSTDPDSYKSDSRRLFSGKLLLIIASNGEAEDVRIRVAGNRCRGAEMILPAKKVPVLPGVSFGQKAYSRPLPEEASVRRVDIRRCGNPVLTPGHDSCGFTSMILPENPAGTEIIWQVTNAAGIESPEVTISGKEAGRITVRARGDGEYYLRALCMENGRCVLISQLEFRAEGFGNAAADPYGYISAGLYDLHEGEIGTGNEKGIAFARDGESMIGFSRVDFGKTGSDRITVDIFALNDDPYDLELYTLREDGTEKPAGVLHYHKPSIWNVYQPETWQLAERLTGIQTLCFRMRDKVHMKGFRFEKQSGAWMPHSAGSADRIYGDSFRRDGEAVKSIGNNVTLTWNDLDFGGAQELILALEGSTPLTVNTVTVRIRNEQGEEITCAADYQGKGDRIQRFPVRVPEGNCTVSFVFLPGSMFDFNGFCFYRQ